MQMPDKILFITLSNIGDVILTLPALDYLRQNFPKAKITVICGPRPKEIFEGNPFIEKLIAYDKYAGLKEKIALFNRLKKEGFAAVVDLRNTFFGVFLPARYKISLFADILRKPGHMKDKHLAKIKKIVNSQEINKAESSLYISQQERQRIKELLKQNNIAQGDLIIAVAPGARSRTKIWPKEKFVELIDRMAEELSAKVILVGDGADRALTKYIADHSSHSLLDLSGSTTIKELGALLEEARLLITNDSAVLHLASYLNVPVVALFGPTDDKKYGPWCGVSAVVKKDIFCRPCEKAQCRFASLECLGLIKAEDVLRQVKNILVQSSGAPPYRIGGCPAFCGKFRGHGSGLKRILIVRTDKIGDVLLSTPVVKALRDNYPNAYIAMMVRPYAREIVEGNPYLDEVIAYDKEKNDKGFFRFLSFAFALRKKRFDLAVVLHPTNRAHLLVFLAGIAKRIGYNRKFAFLLTESIAHIKQFGEKHEVEYALDLVSYLGVTAKDKGLFMPLKEDSERWVEELLRQEGISVSDKLLVINPAASCPSKLWPAARFSEIAGRLNEKYAFKTIIVGAAGDSEKAAEVATGMRSCALNLAGRTSISQLASLLKRCSLFISNDSGPVHIASALGVPVIAIFGRKQKGLSPKRWGPTGEKARFLHKDAGCHDCLAHNCKKGFACLKAISVDDLMQAAQQLLGAPKSI